MRIHLNLVPLAIQRRREMARRRRALIGVPLVIVAVVAGLYLLLLGQEAQARRVSRETEELLIPLRPLGLRLAGLQSQTEEVERRRQEMLRVLQQQQRWSAVMDDVSRLIPQDAWLQSMTLEPGILTLSVAALQLRTVAQFVQSLAASPAVADVQVPALQQTQAGGRMIPQFTIRARLKALTP